MRPESVFICVHLGVHLYGLTFQEIAADQALGERVGGFDGIEAHKCLVEEIEPPMNTDEHG